MKKQAAGSEKAFFSKSGTSCNIQVSHGSAETAEIQLYGKRDEEK